MATVNVNGLSFSNKLNDLLMAQSIEPGADLSYELCKVIYEYHPLGLKMAEAPIALAQSMPRQISVQNGPEDRLREQFESAWKEIGADDAIYDAVRIARIYGASTLGLLIQGVDPELPIDYTKLAGQTIALSVWDPLNTAGSLVLNQLPNAIDFLKPNGNGVSISSSHYHRSRVITFCNERPIYLGYTTSAFGYVGRSVYQRALYALQSFLLTMKTDAMVSRKAGALIMKLKAPGSVINQLMTAIWDMKRLVVKAAETDNVVSVGHEDSVESLNMQNLEGPATMARNNILNNIATSADMPAVMLTNETMTEGFGEGTEDANRIAQWIDRFRIGLSPLYTFMDRIVQYRAWNPDFYKALQAEFPAEYGNMEYNEAFVGWRNSFKAEWPSIIKEPDSEKAKVDEIRLKAITDLLAAMIPSLDPINKAIVLLWAADNFNELPMLFSSQLVLEPEELKSFHEEQAQAAIDQQGAEIETLKNGDNKDEEGDESAAGGQDRPGQPSRADSAVIDALKRSIEDRIRNGVPT